MRQYSALPHRPLRPRTRFHTPGQALPPQVTHDDPAVAVMTDFQKVTAFTIDPDVSVDGAAREDARVRDIMTPEDRIEVISMEDVQHAHVGHVVATLKATGRRHAAVVDEDGSGNQVLRGLFAASQLARQLGEPVETAEIAQNFAEISLALKA